MDPDVLCVPQTVWGQPRNISDGSLNNSSEQMALIGFAHRLCSVAVNNEPGIVDENDVRKEAKLLLSLSCSSPTNIIHESGRITPTSDVSSCQSSASKRDSFSFTCPSLSLEKRSNAFEEEDLPEKNTETSSSPPPAVLLGRSLKVDDKDALRLQSEAMARNIMQSYQKAIDWRIQSWVDALSAVLVNKEKDLKEQGASQDEIRDLLNTAEARLVVTLSKMRDEIHVIDAHTSFKVLPEKAPSKDEDGPQSKRSRIESDEERSCLEETEYEYHVCHLLTLNGFLNIHTPGAGYVQIDLQVPGTMKGTFLSTNVDDEHLTEVMVDLDTEILASMIEKSSRTVVRASVEALLEEEANTDTAENGSPAKSVEAETTSMATPVPTSLPKRKYSDIGDSGLVLITPRDSYSPASLRESDSDEKPILLSIPDNFMDGPTNKLKMLAPDRSRGRDVGIPFTSQLPIKKRDNNVQSVVVTPHKSSFASIEGKGQGPNLPTLVEVACAAIRRK